jgi:hypothetical protein
MSYENNSVKAQINAKLCLKSGLYKSSGIDIKHHKSSTINQKTSYCKDAIRERIHAILTMSISKGSI